MANQILLNWLVSKTMMAWWSRDFENYQINKYLEMLRPLNLTNMCISEDELSEVFGIDW